MFPMTQASLLIEIFGSPIVSEQSFKFFFSAVKVVQNQEKYINKLIKKTIVIEKTTLFPAYLPAKKDGSFRMILNLKKIQLNL